MRHYINRNIYFNTVVSQYFNVPFNNGGETVHLKANYILYCSVVTWDIDTRNLLSELGEQEISLLGKGTGDWEIFTDQLQDKPDTEKWNTSQDDDVQADNGRHEAKKLDDVLRGLRMMFI